MRIGIGLATETKDGRAPTLSDVAKRAALIEKLGFDGIWMGDTVGRRATAGVDALHWLQAAASGTERVELGTAVMQVPLRHPVELAQRVLTLYALSNGRFSFGVGSGSLPVDFVAVGVDHSQRFKLLNAGVPAIRKLLNGESVGTANLHPWADVVGKPRMLVAAWYNGRWIERAAKQYDGWIASGLNSSFGELKEGIKKYRDLGGQRALVATVQLNFEGSTPTLAEHTNFTLRCPPAEAKDRLAQLADLGYDDVLLGGGGGAIDEDGAEEKLQQIIELRPSGAHSAIAAGNDEQRPRAMDPVCRRYIDLVTMTSPTSTTVFKLAYQGNDFYVCSPGCKDAFEKRPEVYVR